MKEKRQRRSCSSRSIEDSSSRSAPFERPINLFAGASNAGTNRRRRNPESLRGMFRLAVSFQFAA